MAQQQDIEPQSVAADKEARTFRVLKRDETARQVWREKGYTEAEYSPSAQDIGAVFGEGEYLLIEERPDSYAYTTRLTVVAETRYRRATVEEELAATGDVVPTGYMK